MLLFILTIFIIFSGCVEENNATQSNESAYQDLENISSTTPSPEEENTPEIEVTSFSSIYMRDNTERVYEYLFSWDNVPGNESQSLISYLKNDMGIDWADNAQIVKTNDNETIRVFTSENSLEFTLEDNKSKILTTIGSDSYYDSKKIKKENSKICVCRLEYEPGYNITEKYYAVYGLSIKNNGSNNLDFNLNELHVRDGNHIFNTTIEPESQYSYRNEIFSDLKKETKIEDTTLFPGQIINGFVIFQVNSLYNESFLLMYKGTPITSTSFEKNIKVLRTAESYNYSIIFGIPPYDSGGLNYSFEPDFKEYPYIWPNWVNRSVLEVFNKADSENMAKLSIENTLSKDIEQIPPINIVYALKVIPERNVTMIPKIRSSYFSPYTLCVGDTGEELINSGYGKIIILNSQMGFSNATIVKISYQNVYGRKDRLSFIDQDLILDDKLNIVVAKYYCGNFV
jgi:hypothetical protein